MRALSERIAGLAGWRRPGAAALLGALAAAALPPVHLLPLLLVAFPGFLWLLGASRGPWAAFAIGWWFGFGHFVAGLYWLVYPPFTDPARFAWAAPFAVLGLPAVLAAFTGAAALATWLAGLRGGGRVLALALAWTAAEWLRGQVFTGFPWNFVGYAWTFSPAMIQLAAAVGVYGLSFMSVVLAALPATLAERRGAAGLRLVAAGIVALAAVWVLGTIRLAGASGEVVPGVRLRIVQANIAQPHNWRPDRREAQFRDYLQLSSEAALTPVTHLIWPETAAPFFLSREPERARLIGALAPPRGLVLTGAPRISAAGVRPPQIWNSVHAIGPGGGILASYDKFHLVPFGEYVPLRRWLGALGVEKLVQGQADFSTGPGPRTLVLPGLPPVGPLICYEAIFPGRVTARGDRPAWLLNLTNDAWFGISSGPYQHVAMARMRAVEEGLPLVRAANSGVSAVVDAHGRVLASLGLGRRGVVDAALPRALAGPPPYGRYGDWILLPLALALGLVLAWLRRARRRYIF